MYAGEAANRTVGNTCETQERDPGDTDRLGIIYLDAGER